MTLNSTNEALTTSNARGKWASEQWVRAYLATLRRRTSSRTPVEKIGDCGMRLKDKVALVTGASSGIGKGIAERFAAEGAQLVMNYRPGGKLDADAAQAEASKLGPTSVAIAADVSKREDVERMME